MSFEIRENAFLPDEQTEEPEPGLRWWREVLIALVFYGVYSFVRNTFGAGPESKWIAFRHARGIIKVEKFLGLWHEPRIQHWYLNLPFNGFIKAWNVFYGTAHFIVTIGVLVFAFRVAPRKYTFARTVLAATTALALFGFALYTLMPPRLLDADGPYGACAAIGQGCNDYGLIDTIERWGGLWKFGEGGAAAVSNQYAAMPSLHFGWSSWCALTMIWVIGRGRRRFLWLLYPLVTLFCIIVTANHYWLDAFFGGVALAGGWVVAKLLGVVVARFSTWRELNPSRSP
ncbi:MAG: phosphatase PAP2 family protein [Acidimicrobiales bacterium]|nr:phosphatase PAP2 family protein [Acidimicrobiales bacterium]